jgi:hypothetical protein
MSYVVLKTRKTQPAMSTGYSAQHTIQYNSIDTLVSQSSVNTAVSFALRACECDARSDGRKETFPLLLVVASEVEKIPEALRHQNPSAWPGVRDIAAARVRRLAKSGRRAALILPRKSRIHVPSCSAPCKLLFFLLDALKSSGQTWHGGGSSPHASVQKRTTLPSPTMIVVAAAKTALSACEHGTSMPSQGSPGVVLASHVHRSRRAWLNLRRFRIPRPPRLVGRQTRPQATLQWPPKHVYAPRHSHA